MRGNPKKLVPLTTQKAREIGALGGKKTAENRAKKKLLSEIYAAYLAKANDVEGYANIDDVVTAILKREDSASVSMMKEIREATEGNKLEHSGSMSVQIVDDIPL